jgi:adenosylcobinamide kinase/adenosylcobinamide-phosphate guanylyltransferase
MKHFILGGARSGKSRFAETQAISTGKNLVYIATAQALDEEMRARISHHQSSRTGHWLTVEEPLKLAAVLQQHAAKDNCILVDCLTLWLTNILLAGEDTLQQELSRFLDTVPTLEGDIVFVSNEVGMGLVAADPLSRRFVDEAGRLHQTLAGLCDAATMVVAGLPLALKR